MMAGYGLHIGVGCQETRKVVARKNGVRLWAVDRLEPVAKCPVQSIFNGRARVLKDVVVHQNISDGFDENNLLLQYTPFWVIIT